MRPNKPYAKISYEVNQMNKEKLPSDRKRIQKKVLAKLRDFVQTTGEKNLYHIRVYTIAQKLGVEPHLVLGAFIQGVSEGLFTMAWFYHCPHCGGVANETIRIHEATHEDYCKNCQVNFENVLDSSVEVCFNVHPGVRRISEDYNQKYFTEMQKKIDAGEYNVWKKGEIIRGVDVLQNPAYRELMGTDVLVEDQSLTIEHASVLFTDVRGSTQMYSTLGDAKAFILVREHFQILFATIEEFGGVPVKTIGDAVMGVFVSRAVALRCSLEAQKRLQEFYKERTADSKIEVKMGLHCGTTIVVTLNDRIDYFGNTVNLAARIESVSEPNELVVSKSILDVPESSKILKEYKVKMKKTKAPFKGIEGKSVIYRIRF